MSLNHIQRLALSIGLLSFSAGALLTQFSGTLYPGLTVGAAGCMLIVTLVVLRTKSMPMPVLAIVCVVTVLYRLHVFLFPASLISFDPDAYAVRALTIVQSGSTEQLVGPFYSIASGFSVFLAETILITDLPPDTAMLVIPLASALIFPLSAAAVAKVITSDNKVAIIAACLAVLSPAAIQFSVRPVPIMFAALLFSVLCVALVSYTRVNTHRYLMIFMLILTSMVFVHKIPLLLFVMLCIVMIFGSYRPIGNTFRRESRKIGYTLGFLGIILLSVQWIFITPYVASVSGRLIGLFGLSVRGSNTNLPTAAEVYQPSLIDTIVASGYIFTTLFVGGIIWVILAHKQRYVESTARLLGIVALIVGIALPGTILNSAAAFPRIIFFATSTLAGLIAVGWLLVGESYGKIPQYIVSFGIILIVLSQPFSAAAVPDYRDGPRQYLTEGEVDAKTFSQKAQGIVYMDAYYWDETVNFERAVANGEEVHQRQVPNPNYEGILTDELLNETLSQHDYQYVLLRNDVTVYRMAGGRWTLNWNPTETMERSIRYNKVYSNSEATLFSRKRT